MKIFLDTANLDEIRQGVELGVVDGVTTNPTLIAKEGKPFRQHILEICSIVKNGDVSAEVVSTDTANILREAHDLVPWHPNIYCQNPHDSRWRARPQPALQRRHPRQRHAGLFRHPGAAGRKSRRILCQPVSWDGWTTCPRMA